MSAVAAAPASGRRLSRGARLGLLLGPGFICVVLPFVAAMALLGAYSLNLRDTTGAGLGLSVWSQFLGDPFNWRVIWSSVQLAALSTVITILIAYPTAAALLRVRNRFYLVVAYVALFSPLLVSVISRSYGWLLLLSDTGFVNQTFGLFGLGPYRMVFNETGVIIALVHVLLPYAVLPILNIMTQVPPVYREAALDLGASGWTVFRQVTLPLTLPGVIVAAEIIFALSISAFVTPSLLGGGRVLTLSRMLYDNIGLIEWGMAAVQAIVLLTTALAVLFVLERVNRATHAARQD
ncbi:ABC transporter permease [Chelatococcus asaccharovorans]|uniref:Putative spermidine/putrescine transport system permease protein n=1 Tax=Chelatococcus asaccharovorans TaxID=28210 RepID=A0A2V3UFC2_9HYPH|nr:ABC transporter permease [Chelatococcus asaccharovorans]MBS7707398.1 ABC transporter permease [Chelatococcus asaccharovorans]PXW63578.1 putative spermidine/putrescine transport system permease protein [Chelatococcus asaccharovorans]